MDMIYEDYSEKNTSSSFLSYGEKMGSRLTYFNSGRYNPQEFIKLFKTKFSLDLFSPSVPRFPEVEPLILHDLPDPSKRSIPLTEVGKNLDDAFQGFIMSSSKVRSALNDKILYRKDYESMTDKVRIISSGVGGWEGFVGRGMLTCMVLGTYSTPKPMAIYKALKELNKTADCGILAIVPNNYEDKLNWGIALARAQRKRFQMDIFTFGDNAYEGCKVDERNGLSGIVICYKLAGGMSEEKITLPVIVDRLKLMYFATISCHFGDAVHIGTDLNGNGGSEMKDATRNMIMKEVMSYLVDSNRKYSVGHDPEAEFVVFINTYSLNWLLSQVVAMEVVQRLHEEGHKCIRVYTGSLVLSVPDGFSVTILPEGDDDITRWLDRFTDSPGWLVGGTGSVCKYYISTVPTLYECRGIHFNSTQISMVKRVIQLADSSFSTEEVHLNSCDPHKVYGTNMCHISNLLLKGMESNNLLIEFPYIMFTIIAESFENIFNNMDGQMFAMFSTSMGQYFAEHKRSPKRITDKVWQRALQRSVKSVASYFKVGYKDHTILDIFGSLYMIMAASGLDTLTDLHLALEVGEEQCRKAKNAKSKKIIDSPYPTMKTAHIILEAAATMLRETTLKDDQITARDIYTTPTLTAERIKDILTSK